MYKIFCWLAGFLSAIGAINWGLVAFFKFNLVEFADGLSVGGIGIDKIIYAVIALAGIYLLTSLFTGCKV